MKFKCIKNTGKEIMLTVGKVYEGKPLTDNSLYIEIEDLDNGLSGAFLNNCFELVEEQKDKEYGVSHD